MTPNRAPGSDRLDHTRVLRARGAALPPEGLPPATILDSWVRCMDAGLDLGASPVIQVVEAADLARRREQSAAVHRLARAELETLSQQIAGSNYLLAFADRDGVILDLHADNRFAMSDANASIVPGSRWTEALCGTNGLGTALVTGQPVAVTGLEHYFLKLGAISCTASPIRDAAGDIVGVLDASSYYESRQRHTQALVQMAAIHIENGLLLQQMRTHWLLAIHPRAEFLGTLSAGLLAFGEQGRLLAINARGRQLLSGLAAVRGADFDTLFAEGFAALRPRLLPGHELQLRDVLGSTLVVRTISRPAPRQGLLATPAERPVHQGTLHAPRAEPPARGAPGTPACRAANAASPPATAPVVNSDPAVLQAVRTVQAAVALRAPILILGETGCGKELLARQAHQLSGRSGEFVAVNCGALSEELFEAELFGYVGGAFTGARREGSPGLIARADRGTLLLDEIRELPASLQSALLRFLDDQVLRPVGGGSGRSVDVQLLAATHADLEAEVSARRFRADLLYRLNTVTVSLPPLRLRRDFADAVRQVLASVSAGIGITDAAVERLAEHGWPGNFRELRAVLTRAVLAQRLCGDAAPIQLDTVDRLLPASHARSLIASSQLQRSGTELVLREFERSGYSVSRTSRSLGISRTTVYRHLREAGRR